MTDETTPGRSREGERPNCTSTETLSKEKPMPIKTHHLALRVKTTSGEFNDDVNISNRTDKIVEDAIHKFHLNPNPPQPYLLKRGSDGSTIPLGVKINDLTPPLHEGDLVIVQAPEVEDG
jgi:hypothetical protein